MSSTDSAEHGNSVASTPSNTAAASTTTSTASTTSTSNAVESTPTLPSSKLVPAAAPKVSAWGSKAVTAGSTTSSSSNGLKNKDIPKEQWPTVDVVLSKSTSSPSAPINEEVQKNKNLTTPTPKVKSTGKEKWVPIQAEIVFSPTNKGSNRKKSNGNGSNTNNNSNNNNNKKKQSNNNNNKSQQKKDSKNSKKTNTNIESINGNGTKKDLKDLSEGVSNISLQSQESEHFTTSTNGKSAERNESNIEIKSATTTNASTSFSTPNSSTATPSVDSSVPVNILAEDKVIEASPSITSQEPSFATDTDPTSNGTSQINIEDSQEPHQEHRHQSQQQQHHHLHHHQQHQNRSNSRQNYNNGNKKYQHRNSEPFSQNNSQYPQNHFNRGRRSNPKAYNNYRHSVTGFNNYPNVPFMMNPPVPGTYNFNYAPNTPFQSLAPPGVTPNPINGYQFNNNFNLNPPGSRSVSHSPNKNDTFTNLNIPQTSSPFSPAFGTTQPIIYPYQNDAISMIAGQLNYYFSIDNLLKDFFLRKQMNSQGFVPLTKLIEFKRLQVLTGGDINLLINASVIVESLEFKNGKVRARENWSNWILPFNSRDECGKLEEDDQEENENQVGEEQDIEGN